LCSTYLKKGKEVQKKPHKKRDKKRIEKAKGNVVQKKQHPKNREKEEQEKK